MAKRKPLKPILKKIAPPSDTTIAPPPVTPPVPPLAVSITDLRHVAQLAQDGITALLKDGVALERLGAHAVALIGLQRALNIGNQSAAAAVKSA